MQARWNVSTKDGFIAWQRIWWTTYPGYNGSYCGKGLDPFGEDIHEIFGLENWQRINRIRDMDGGEKELRWLQEEEESGEKISQETLKWMCAYKINPRDIEFIRDLMRPQQVMNYLIRQKQESYPSLGYKEILEQYADYISMSLAAQKDLTDPDGVPSKRIKTET